MLRRINTLFDSVVRHASSIGGAGAAFRVCGCAALSVGVALNVGLAARLNLSVGTSLLVALAGLLTIPVVAMATKIIKGEERLFFYHHFVAVLCVASALLWLTGRPLLPHLDVLMLACGGVRAFGYFACLLAGCCHGQPCRLGVAYGAAHVAAGLPPQFLGVRLFPSQVFESAWAFGALIAGCALILDRPAPGTALAFFITAYCPARFFFEFARWYAPRDLSLGLSNAQWISLALVASVVGLEACGALPARRWHAAILIVVAAAAAVAAVIGRARRPAGGRRLYHPDHVSEIVSAVGLSDLAAAAVAGRQRPAAANVALSRTSLGIQISSGRIARGGGETYHYALSRRGENLTDEEARGLAALILEATPHRGARELIKGGDGVFHLLISG